MRLEKKMVEALFIGLVFFAPSAPIAAWAGEGARVSNKGELVREGSASLALQMMEEVRRREREVSTKEDELRAKEERLRGLAQEMEAAARDLQRREEELRAHKEAETGESGIAKLARLIEGGPPEQGAKILEGLDSPTAARVLSRMNPRKAGRFLSNMQPEKAVKVSRALIEVKR